MTSRGIEMSNKIRNISISVVLGLAVALSWIQPLDSTATRQVEDGLKRALASYAIARTLNAVISVAQGTEVSVQMGVGATFAPGQILDPLNDLVEQFGDFMLASSVAFGIMLVLIKIGNFWIFSLLLTILTLVWLWMQWRNTPVPELLMKIVIVLLFVRFSISIVTVGSDFVFKQFMETEYNQNAKALQINSAEVSMLGKNFETKDVSVDVPIKPATPAVEPQAVPIEKNGVLDRLASGWNSMKSTASDVLKINERLEKLKTSATKLTENIVKIIVVFILQTIIVPIIWMWLLYKLMIGVTRSIEKVKA